MDGVPATDADPAHYLRASYFVDHHSAAVRGFVQDALAGQAVNADDEVARAVALFYAVRDKIRYNPYSISGVRGSYKASSVIEAGEGWCVSKGALMTACARALGIPARPGYADVRNHLTSERLTRSMGTDVFAYHGYVELWLRGCWVKVTPVFNIELCEKFGVVPQEFDGASDSLFQEFDAGGRRHMEYLQDRGPYTDVPFAEIMADFSARYPRLYASLKHDADDHGAADSVVGSQSGASDFAAEAEAERSRNH